MLLVGGGAHLSLAYDACLRLVEEQSIPLAHTISGKGAIACSHAFNAGLFGRYSRIANDLIAECDLLIVAGCKLGEIATKRFQLLPEGVPVVHLDILAEEFGRTSRCDVALWGDMGAGLADLADALHGRGHDRAAPERAEWAAGVAPRMAKWKHDARDRLESTERPINLARLIGELNRLMPGCSSPMAASPATGPGCCSRRRRRGATTSRTAASPRSATACPARSARSWASGRGGASRR
jgi:acetolactate synthase-1/2/3 large subunit